MKKLITILTIVAITFLFGCKSQGYVNSPKSYTSKPVECSSFTGGGGKFIIVGHPNLGGNRIRN